MDATVVVPTVNPGVAYRAVGDGEGVLLHLESGQYHGVNETGKTIYELIDGTRDSAGIAGELASRYADAPEELHTAVRAFLSELATRGLVRL